MGDSKAQRFGARLYRCRSLRILLKIDRLARKLRIQLPGPIYHIMKRGARREPIFSRGCRRPPFRGDAPGAVRRRDGGKDEGAGTWIIIELSGLSVRLPMARVLASTNSFRPLMRGRVSRGARNTTPTEGWNSSRLRRVAPRISGAPVSPEPGISTASAFGPPPHQTPSAR